VAQKAYVNTDMDVILGRMLGRYDQRPGQDLGRQEPHEVLQRRRGELPYLSDGMWFLTQHKRWGLLKDDPDYLAVAKKVNRIDIYKQAATVAGVALPKSDMRSTS
jgi:nitrate/nitrite transport system substrate-binding protein